MQNSGRPPPINAQFSPNNLAVQRHPSRLAVVTKVLVARRLVQLETLNMKRGRALVAKHQVSRLRADKAPSHIYMGQSRFLFRGWGHVMLGADNLGQSDLNSTGCHAIVIGMVGRRTPDTPDQFRIVLHVGILGIVRSAGVTAMGGTG